MHLAEFSIGHISPEAAEGGPIAFVEDGDIIELDMNNRKITLKFQMKKWQNVKRTGKALNQK